MTNIIGVDEGTPRGDPLITLDESDQNSIVVASGSNYGLRPEHIQVSDQVFR